MNCWDKLLIAITSTAVLLLLMSILFTTVRVLVLFLVDGQALSLVTHHTTDL